VTLGGAALALVLAAVEIQLASDPAHAGTIEVRGLDAADLARLRALPAAAPVWSRLLSVSVAESADDLPGMLGDRAVEGPLLRFTPRFALVAGLAYQVRFDPAPLALSTAAVTAGLQVPSLDVVPSTHVVASFPSGPLLPANLLRVYLVFSAPMRVGDAFDHIRLREVPSGRVVEHAFAEGGTELWDPQRRRLTLLFDPGRIKRGLVENARSGAPLREGARYQLEIDAAWRDARGLRLRDAYVREFAVGAAQRDRLEPAAWSVGAPRAGTREPLSLRFPVPLDQGLLEAAIAVRGSDGQGVDGSVEIGPEERAWSFTPAAAWPAGRHELAIAPRLEDAAGNSLFRAFDHDLTAPDQAAPTNTLPFEVR
jgi:hypothetical protein